MLITRLSATNFRNLSVENVYFTPGLNILHGKNAQGKTNILETIYFSAYGRALRGKSDNELIKWDEKESIIRIETCISGQKFLTDVHIEKQGKKTSKHFLVDKLPVKHLKDLFGKLLIVMFGPEDLRLIKNGPAERRRFMDMEICQLSPVYYNDIKEYHRILRHRNALLRNLQKDKLYMDTLFAWDEQLVYYARRISETRGNFVEKINIVAKEIYKSIAGGEELSLVYKPSLINCDSLKKNHDRDIYRGMTSEGIHTDEIEFIVCGRGARIFASQGQQRSAALSAKLAEISLIKEITGDDPILLLDDVLSELDSYRQEFLLNYVTAQQTILTATGVHDLVKKVSGKHNIMQVVEGRVLSWR